MIILNNDQSLAKSKFNDWYKKGNEQIFKLDGRAGTGKTTVAMNILDGLNISIKDILFVTYVGKAVLRMILSGMNAHTLHSAIYNYVRVPEKNHYKPGEQIRYTYKFIPRDKLPANIKFIVLDEDGMVPDNMLRHLMSFGLPIFSMGDGNQLPPIFGKSTLLPQPHAVLNEIMRQKKGDAILHIADSILNDRYIEIGQYGPRCFVMDSEYLKYKDIYKKAHVAICARNKTRDVLNKIIREQVYGITGDFPKVGDRLVCRKNNRDAMLGRIPMTNGLFGYVRNVYPESFNGKSINIDFQPEFMEDDMFINIPLDYEYFKLPWEDKDKYNKLYTNGNLFEFGDASTCHLAQGSQYGSIIVLEERIGDTEFHKRWMYTAVTRAEHTLLLFKEKRKKYY